MVINIDKNIFGNYFFKHKNLENYKLDIQDIKINLKNVHSCIHLLNIANDPMTDLNPSLVETSLLNLFDEHLIKNKVKKIIYACQAQFMGLRKKKSY